MKNRLIRIVRIIVAIEIAYLILANLALNLPLTQELVNQHRPEKYAVYWERAWTWYPLRIHVRGISANGQTSSQQWQAEVSRASASLSVFPLVLRTARVSGVNVEDVEFRLRPRPRPDKDRSAIREFFPPIRDRDPDLPAAPKVPKSGAGWKIAIDGIRASGDHRVWVYQVQNALSGALAANLTYTTRGGPFALTGGEADLEVRSLLINDQPAVSQGGTVEGHFALAPFVPSENRGIKALGFLTADVQVDAEVHSLDFLDIYLSRFNGMELNGEGSWRGRLHYDQGDLVSETDMTVSASKLILNAIPYRVEGTGDISVSVDAEDPASLSIGILFGMLNAYHQNAQAPLFSGEKLEIGVQGNNRILPDDQRETGRGRVSVRIPQVAVSDLSVYQYLLPDRWHARLNGGTGSMVGQAEFSSSALSADLRLQSDDADLAFKDYRFVTSLDLGVKARGGTSDMANIDLSGTYLRLDGARLASEAKGTSPAWNASLTVPQGALGFPIAGLEKAKPGFKDLVRTLKKQNLRDALETMDAELDAHLNVSDLGWLNLLFRNRFDLAIAGAGEAEANLDIRSGWLAEGTSVRVQPKGLQVQVLDYVAQGEGSVDLVVERGGEMPDMVLNAQLRDGELRRRGEEKSVIEEVDIAVKVRANDVTIGEDATVDAIDLRIPSARVRDMTVYNQHFPEKMPLRLSAGEAELSADIHLEQESAGGYVKLQTDGLQSRLDDQQLAGELSLDINLKGGVPSNMAFDISGSSLRLDDFKVVGDEKNFDQPGWSARFDIEQARVVWKKPVLLDMEGKIRMHDTRPIVALLANQRGKYGWIEKLLTVEDIEGNAKLNIASGEVSIPYAFAGSDKIDVGAKGLMNAETREGIFLARYRKLTGILKVKDGERNFDIIGARKKFDAYVPGNTSAFAKDQK